MRRTGLFALLLGVSAMALVLVSVWYLSSYQAGYGSMAGMMGQMMGNQYAAGAVAPMPSYVWATIAALFVLTVGGVGGFAYYLAVPEIKRTAAVPSAGYGSPLETTETVSAHGSSSKERWSVLLQTSKLEERKVLEVLESHDGRYLQKFIVKESGLSKLKTHRIISRFAERGIVVANKSGNTNEISLAPWIRQDGEGKSPD